MTTTEPLAKRTGKKGRSPSYPGISLDIAVDRAKALYKHERRHPAPLSAIMEHWGYAKRSGPGLVTVAALRKFGLLEYQGAGEHRTMHLSDLAVEILLNPEPLSTLQRAALEPDIHRELWEEYGVDLPSDETLRYNLITKRGFTEVGADEFIPEWKRTIAFAQLGTGTVFLNDGDSGSGSDSQEVVPMPVASPLQDPAARVVLASTAGVARSLNVPLLRGSSATLILPPTMTEADWVQLLRVLDAMKPGLISDDEGSTGE